MYGKSILAAAMSVIVSFFCVPAVAQSYFGDRDDNNVTVEVKTYYMNKNDYSSGVCEFRPVRSYKNYYSVIVFEMRVEKPYNIAKPLLVTVELYFNDDCCE